MVKWDRNIIFINYDLVPKTCLQNIKKISYTNRQYFHKLLLDQNHLNVENDFKRHFNLLLTIF